uniref:Uncharacterized protein n=1 Tax=Ciona intestinalis TaxID=7719 RepID=H2XY87_CIOIN
MARLQYLSFETYPIGSSVIHAAYEGHTFRGGWFKRCYSAF